MSRLRPQEMWCVLPATCLHINKEAHVANNVSCVFENNGLLQVIGTQAVMQALHCKPKCGNISETFAT